MSDTLNTLIARIQREMDSYDSETLGDDPAVFDLWLLLADALEALRSGTPTETDANYDAAWQARDWDEVRRIQDERSDPGIPSRTLVAESSTDEEIAEVMWAVMRRGKMTARFDSETDGALDTDGVFLEIAQEILAEISGPVMDAADVWDAGWRAGVYDEHHNLDNTPNPYRGGTT